MAVRSDTWPRRSLLSSVRASGAALLRLGRHALSVEFEPVALFGLSLALYLTIASLLLFGAHLVIGDAWSRVGNAYYMIFSRDPHLAAIGFVWNPLPSLAVLPLLPFSLIWPALAAGGFAGNIVSALFMAASVVQVAGMLRDLGTRRLLRLVLVACFALHPMILYYGANGMSEAPFLFFLLVTARYLTRWLRDNETAPLLIAALGLAGAYLTRYEAAAAALGTIAFVTVVSAIRTPRGRRLVTASADGLTFATPFVVVFGAWALASWIIVGSPFETFTSIYGNSSQVALSMSQIQQSTGSGFLAASEYAIAQILGLEPLIVLTLAVTVVVALARRDARALPTLVVLGSVLAFELFAFATGRSFGWLRFYIGVIPLVVIMVGVVATSPSRIPVPRPILARAALLLVTLVTLATAVASVPAAAATMRVDRLAREEAHQLRGLIPDPQFPGDVPPEHSMYELGGQVASYLDSLNIADGKVLVDVALGFPIVLQSRDPHQFVITPDRDFKAFVQDPVIYKAQYLLVSPPSGMGFLDAITRQYPGLYASGKGLPVTLVREFESPTAQGMAWRLYRLDPPKPKG